MAVLTKIIAIAMVPILSFAGIGDTWMSGKEGTSYVKISPGHFESQSRSGYMGGGMRVRWQDTGTVSLVNINPPGMSVGCDGIDLTFGSFSFLDPSEFVNKAKAIASAAPAFAFKMALSTLCKECDTIMQELESAINEINSISMDSCALSQEIGNFAGRAIGEGVRDGSKRDQVESESDYRINRDGAFYTYIGKIKNTLGGDLGLTQDYTGMGSAVKRATSKYAGLGANEGQFLTMLIMSLVGDVYGFSKDGDMAYHVQDGSLEAESSIEMIMNGTKSGSSGLNLKLLELVESPNGDVMNAPAYNKIDANAFFAKGFADLIEDRIASISAKVQAGNTLDAADITFMNSVDIPVWKAVNLDIYKSKIGISGNILSDDVISALAYEQTGVMLNYVFNKIKKDVLHTISKATADSMSKDSIDKLREFTNKINLTTERFQTSYKDQRDLYISEKTDIAKLINDFEKQFRQEAITNFSARGW